MAEMKYPAKICEPGLFDNEKHFYQRALNAQIHPMVSYFLSLDQKRIITRYCHLHPSADAEALHKILCTKPHYFRWSGADLFNVTTKDGHRQTVVIETNSCPSGQKSMPLLDENEEHGGYLSLIQRTVKPFLDEADAAGKLVEGVLAVIYDKNVMEAHGYANTLADVYQENVYLTEWYHNDGNPAVRVNDDLVLEVCTADGVWHPVRAAFRYVTQKPWSRIPIQNIKTLIINPIAACLAGGRNKALAAKAYDFYNADLARQATGLLIRTPETIRDVSKEEVPLYVKSFGGHAVVKVPYSNAGQGVYTITSKEELAAFMNEEASSYDNYIVQSLIGNYKWSSVTQEGQFFHTGTIPNKQANTFVSDVRMMVHYDMVKGAYRPLVVYARRARMPLKDTLAPDVNSWDMLGTNLSVKKADGTWDTETSRLLLMDRRDFNQLGLSIDELIDGFIQTVLSSVAIDRMANKILPDGDDPTFNIDLFRSLNKDEALIEEIRI